MADLKALAEELVNLTVKDVNELATILKEEYGIEPAAAAVAVAAAPAAGAGEAAEVDFSPLYPCLKGTTALLLCDTANVPAKLIKDVAGKAEIPALKAAYAEESFYVGANQLDALIHIKSKNELIAEVVALLQSPIKNVVSALQSGGNTIHGVLQTLSER